MRNVIAYLVLVLFLVSCTLPKEGRERPDNIPVNSYYLGGIDGGYWIDTLKKSDSLIYCRIYTEHGDFLKNCNIIIQNRKVLGTNLESFTAYDEAEEAFLLKNGSLFKCE